MSTAVLLIVLALQYPTMWGFFAFLIVLDIVSHWFQMVSWRPTHAHTDDAIDGECRRAFRRRFVPWPARIEHSCEFPAARYRPPRLRVSFVTSRMRIRRR